MGKIKINMSDDDFEELMKAHPDFSDKAIGHGEWEGRYYHRKGKNWIPTHPRYCLRWLMYSANVQCYSAIQLATEI